MDVTTTDSTAAGEDRVLSFRFPELTERLPPPRVHPLADREAARSNARCRDQLRGLLPDDTAMERFIAQQIGLTPLYVCPDARPDRVGIVCDVYQLFAVTDDLFDDLPPADRTPSIAHALLDPLRTSLEGDGGASPDAPDYLMPVISLLRRLAEDMTTPQRQRLAAGLAEHAEGCVADVQMCTDGTVTDFDTSLQAHMGSSLGWPVMLMIEYGLGIDASHELDTCPALHRAVELAIQHALLVNDLFSYRKELFQGDAALNLISVFRHHENLTLQQAVDRLCDRILGTERELYAAHDAVLASPAGNQPHVRAYLHALEMFCTGYVRWCFISQRYNGPGHTGSAIPSGIMTLYPDHTEYTALPNGHVAAHG